MARKRRHPLLDVELKPSGLSGSAADIKASFRAMIKRIPCPCCSEPFTDGAVDWGDAWLEGRIDLMRESDSTERDGPYKVKCEWCDERSWINYFNNTATKASHE